MGSLKYPAATRYAVLTQAFAEQTGELYPKPRWEDVASDFEALWNSYVTELEWPEICAQVRQAWETADPRLADDHTYRVGFRS